MYNHPLCAEHSIACNVPLIKVSEVSQVEASKSYEEL